MLNFTQHIEQQVKWWGIDHDGHYQHQLFIGSRRAFKQFCQHHHIICLKHRSLVVIKTAAFNLKLKQRFYTILHSLLQQNYQLTTALSLMAAQCQSDALSPSIKTIITQLNEGRTLSESLRHCTLLADTTMLELIHAGERTQQLNLVIQQLHERQQFQMMAREKLKKALIYPLSVLTGALLLTIGLLTFAIPQFAAIFANFDAKLPWSTQQLLKLSGFFVQHGHMIIASSTLLSIITVVCLRQPHIQAQLSQLTRRLPHIGRLLSLRRQSDWSRVFALCLQAALPLEMSLTLANDTLHTQLTQTQKNLVINNCRQGRSLRDLCTPLNLFPDTTLVQIDIGARGGSLTDTFFQVSAQTQHEFEQQIDRLSKWIEPVIMLMLAIITGGLIITLYLPIFKLGSVL